MPQPDPPDSKEKVKPRWRRVLKRILAGLLILLLCALVFHRPLLRWALDAAAPRLAQSAGYDLQWDVGGSIVSNVTVRGMKLQGPESSVLRSVTLQHANAGYSLWTLITEGPVRALHNVELSNGTIELDTRVEGSARPKKKSSEGPGLAWPDRVDLRNINLHVATKDGDVRVRGLSLLLDEHQPGDLFIEQLILPASNLHLAHVRGKTSVRGKTVTLTDLEVTPEVNVSRLELALSELNKGAVSFQINLRSGEGTLDAKGRLENIQKALSLDVALALHHLSQAEVSRWVRLPENLAWRIEDASLHLRGPLAQPQELDASLLLTATGVHAAGVNADRLQAQAALANGELRVQSINAQAGSNSAEVSGSGALPPGWDDMDRLSARLQWKLDGPKLEELFQHPSDIAGSLHGSGTVALKEGRLGGAQGSVNGKQVRFHQWTLASLTADVTTDAESVKIKSLVAKLDERNTGTVDGQIHLGGRQTADLTWRANLDDVAAVARTAGWSEADSIGAEKLSGGGTVRFDIADIREKNFRNLTARGSAALAGFTWQQRRLQDVSLEFAAQSGRAEVSKLDITFNDQNHVHLSGGLRWEDRQPVDLAWQVDLNDVSTMGSWFAWKPGMPQPDAGTVSAQGSASGALADLRERRFDQVKADAKLRLDGLISAQARFDHAALDFTCRDGRLELSQFEARPDPLTHLTARGHAMLEKPGAFALEAEGAFPRLKDLSPWVEMFKGPALTGGSATLSWHGGGTYLDGGLQGSGALAITDLQLAARPAFSVSLATQHEGRRAQVTGLRASTGKFRIEAKASVSETDLSITPLSVYSGDLSLVSGSVQLPMAFAQQPKPSVPLDATRPVSISLRMRKFEPANLFAAFGLKLPVTGMANGEVEIHGPLPDLAGRVALSITDTRAQAAKGRLDPATVRLDAALAHDRLSVRASVDQKPLRTLTVTGAMPFDAERLTREPASALDTEFEAHLVLPRSDLSIVRRFVPAIAELQGSVGADVKLSGPLRSPHWQAALQAEARSVTFKKTPMDVKDLKARISVADKQIKLDDVSAILAGGELRVAGGVDVTDLTSPVLDLRVDTREALLVRNESLSARTDGTLTCKGTLAKADLVGRADLVRCRVFKEIEFLPLSLPNQLPPAPPPVSPRKSPSFPPPFDQWTINLDIATRDDIRLLGNVLNGSAKANLHLGGTGAAPALEGEVAFEGARVRLPNSRLTITRGKLIFTKDKPFEPLLDAQGESLVGNYEVSVNAYGPALKPKVRFASSPPLSEGEIATLLATGSVGGGEQAAAGAAANAAAFQVLSKAYRRMFDKAAPKRYEEEPPRLTFSFSALSTGTSAPGVSATYEISPRLQATGAVTDRGTFRGMLYYMVRLR